MGLVNVFLDIIECSLEIAVAIAVKVGVEHISSAHMDGYGFALPDGGGYVAVCGVGDFRKRKALSDFFLNAFDAAVAMLEEEFFN